MKLAPFHLEKYFAQWEFKAPYLMGSSDVEALTMAEVLALADDECRQMWESLSLGYTESTGLPILKSEIAQMYEAEEKDLLCFCGAEEGIQCAMHALLSPGDHVVVVTPCYQSLEALPTALGAEVTSVSLEVSEGWKLDVDQLEEVLRENTRLIVINFPHNPTGALMTQAQLDRIVALARQRGAYIFSDEVYRFLEHDPADRLKPVSDIYERGLSLGVLSKAFGLPGLRIGWLVCREGNMLQKIADTKHYGSICNSAPSEILALMSLRNRKALLDRSHQIIESNYRLLQDCFSRYPQTLEWIPAKGGCIAYPRLLDRDVDRFARELVEQEGVLILPASLYSDGQPHFRVGFGRKNFPEVLKRFERFLNVLI